MNITPMFLRRQLLVFISLFFCVMPLVGQTYSYARIKAQNADIKELTELGLALDHVHRTKDFIEGDFSVFELNTARDAGFEVEVIHADAEEAFQLRQSVSEFSHSRNNAECIAGLTDFPYEVPPSYQGGSYQGNFTYQEMLNELDRMAVTYPDLITNRAAIGDFRTHEDRPIYWIKISDNPATKSEGEPQILYTAVHHAKEPVSMTQLIYFMWYVLDHYDQDEEINYLINNTELYFIPCVNPDGYVYNETQRPNGGGLWRKNRRNNGDGTFGVDLNRNYGHKWGFNNAGSSAKTSSEVYRGPSAFSEPETQAVQSFVLDHDFQIALNYHSWGNYLIYPYGYTSNPAEDLDVYQELAALLTRENRFIHGTGLETLSYHTNGDADDWMYGDESKGKIFSMTPEVGSKEHGFWPHESDVEYLCKSALKQNIDAASFLLNSGMLIDESESYMTEVAGSLPFRLTKLGFEEVGFSLSVKPITDNIVFSNTAKFYILDLFASQQDSLSYTLRSDIQDGERIEFVYTVDNGSYVRSYNVTKFYRESRFAMENSGVLAGWKSQGFEENWGESNTVFYSLPTSLTDSPNGNTVPYTTNRITSSEMMLDLADSAVLSFKAKWDIQHDYDFMIVEASLDGSTFIPLCGKYSKAGVLNRNRNLPVYTGRQLNWITEEIDLSEFVGQSIVIRFSMESTNNSTRDGIYIDNLKVLAYDEGSLTGSKEIDPSAFSSRIFPNPANSQLAVVTENMSEHVALNSVKVINQLGQQMLNTSFEPDLNFDVSSWPKGIYFILFEDNRGRQSPARKFVVH